MHYRVIAEDQMIIIMVIIAWYTFLRDKYYKGRYYRYYNIITGMH